MIRMDRSTGQKRVNFFIGTFRLAKSVGVTVNIYTLHRVKKIMRTHFLVHKSIKDIKCTRFTQ